MADDTAVNAPNPPDAIGLSERLKAALRAIDGARSQADILNAMLVQCLGYGSRAALLVTHGDGWACWGGKGFTAHGVDDELVKRLRVAPGAVCELDRVRDHQVVRWDGASLSPRFGLPAPRQAILVPMYVKNNLAAAVYVDATEADLPRFDAPSLQLIVYAVALLNETLATRTRVPSPTLG